MQRPTGQSGRDFVAHRLHHEGPHPPSSSERRDHARNGEKALAACRRRNRIASSELMASNRQDDSDAPTDLDEFGSKAQPTQ